MSLTFHKVPWRACTVALYATAFLFPGASSQQGVPQSPASSAAKGAEYFPPGALEDLTNFFSEYLKLIGEPSLLTAAQDPRAHAYRFVWLSSQHGYQPAVRLSMNPDGSASIITAVESGTPPVPHRTQYSVSDAGVNKFLQMVEKADFWSMPPKEHEKSGGRRRPYKMDASTWVFEGLHNGRYHVVFRQGPEQSPFTEMVRFLTKDLAKLDNSAIPHASRTPSTKPGRARLP